MRAFREVCRLIYRYLADFGGCVAIVVFLGLPIKGDGVPRVTAVSPSSDFPKSKHKHTAVDLAALYQWNEGSSTHLSRNAP